MGYKVRDARHIHEQATAQEGAVAEHGFEQGASRRVVREGQGEGCEVRVVALAGLFAPALAAEPRTLGVAGPRQAGRVDRECGAGHAATPTVIRSATALPQGRPLAKTAG